MIRAKILPLSMAAFLSAFAPVLAGMARAAGDAGPAAAPAATLAASAAKGKEFAFDRSKGNCLSCHQIEGGDLAGSIGPALAGVKSRYPDKADLYALIYDETKRNPQTVMPPFGRNLVLDKDEINAIVDFLYTL